MRKHDADANSEEWKKIKFMIFDAPLVKGNFAQRLKALHKKLDAKKSTVCELLEQTLCKGKEQLSAQMDAILGLKGEGVMLKDPKSEYEGRRSKFLLKVKRFEDTEATVIGHL